MNEVKRYEIELGGKPLVIEQGLLGQLANGAVTVRQGDTVVLVTATMGQAREGIDFFPLTVDYEERLYAVGVPLDHTRDAPRGQRQAREILAEPCPAADVGGTAK